MVGGPSELDVQTKGVIRSGKAGAGDGNRTRDLLFTKLWNTVQRVVSGVN